MDAQMEMIQLLPQIDFSNQIIRGKPQPWSRPDSIPQNTVTLLAFR